MGSLNNNTSLLHLFLFAAAILRTSALGISHHNAFVTSSFNKHPTTDRLKNAIDAKMSSATSLHATPAAASILPVAVSTTDIVRTIAGVFLSHKISKSGHKKGSLSKSGAISAFIVASLSLSCSIRNGLTLLAFYYTSSKLTRVGSKIKGKLEEGHTEGGERGAQQVLACSAIAVACACVRRLIVGSDCPLLFSGAATSGLSYNIALLGDQLTLAYVAFFACCAGDTWASELGVLSKSHPRMITAPWRKVPPGTNGGVSWVGLGASAAGGILMGFLHGLFVPGGIAALLPSCLSFFKSSTSVVEFGREITVLTFVGFLGGFGGSLLDSLLGATIQVTYYDSEKKKIVKGPGPNTKRLGGLSFLSNEMVNVVSTALAALAAALIARPLLTWI